MERGAHARDASQAWGLSIASAGATRPRNEVLEEGSLLRAVAVIAPGIVGVH